MRFLLSINTVFPKTGDRVWYDDQREVHRQIFDGDQMVDYALMGENPDAADNRWLRGAFLPLPSTNSPSLAIGIVTITPGEPGASRRRLALTGRTRLSGFRPVFADTGSD